MLRIAASDSRIKTFEVVVDFPQRVGPSRGQTQKPCRWTSVNISMHCDVFLKVDENRKSLKHPEKFRASRLKRCAVNLGVNPGVGGWSKKYTGCFASRFERNLISLVRFLARCKTTPQSQKSRLITKEVREVISQVFLSSRSDFSLWNL